jgi:hypothetical protein
MESAEGDEEDKMSNKIRIYCERISEEMTISGSNINEDREGI